MKVVPQRGYFYCLGSGHFVIVCLSLMAPSKWTLWNNSIKLQFYHFFLNKQADALIIQTLFCYKILHVSGNLFAHHQDFSTVHSALASSMQVVVDRFQAESGWNLPVPNVE